MATSFKKKNKKLGWHFLPTDMRLGYGDNRKVVKGVPLSVPKNVTPMCCYSGMHASQTVGSAARHEKGPVVCRVEVSGDLHVQHDKFAGRTRTVLWHYTVTKADVGAIAKKCGSAQYRRVSDVGLIAPALYYLAAVNRAAFDAWFDDLTKGKKSAKVAHVCPVPKKPDLDAEAILSQLRPRIVSTKGEILRGIGKFYNMKDSYGYDLFDQLISSLSGEHKIVKISNVTKDGTAGFLILKK